MPPALYCATERSDLCQIAISTIAYPFAQTGIIAAYRLFTPICPAFAKLTNLGVT